MLFYLRYVLAFSLFFSYCTSLEVVVDVDSIYYIFKDIVKGTSTDVSLLRGSEKDLHGHGMPIRPSDYKILQDADLFILYKKPALALDGERVLFVSNLIKSFPSRDNLQKVDPHFWLDPKNVIKIVAAFLDKITALDSDNLDIYKNNYEDFLSSVNSGVDNIASKLRGISSGCNMYFVLHDAYQYFEKFFDLPKPIGYLYDSGHNVASITSMNQYLKIIKDHKMRCVITNNLDNDFIKNVESEAKIVFIDPAGKKFQNQSNFYLLLLEHIASGYQECLSQ